MPLRALDPVSSRMLLSALPVRLSRNRRTQVYSDSGLCLPLLIAWTGRQAVPPSHHACAFALRTPVRPPYPRINPLSHLLDELLVLSRQLFSMLELPPAPALSLLKTTPRFCRIPPHLDLVEA
jgi:hypothetical protein